MNWLIAQVEEGAVIPNGLAWTYLGYGRGIIIYLTLGQWPVKRRLTARLFRRWGSFLQFEKVQRRYTGHEDFWLTNKIFPLSFKRGRNQVRYKVTP